MSGYKRLAALSLGILYALVGDRIGGVIIGIGLGAIVYVSTGVVALWSEIRSE